MYSGAKMFTATGTATVGNLIDLGLSANSFIYLNGSQQLAAGTVSSPLSFSAGTLSLGTVGFANGGTATTTFYNHGVVFSDGSTWQCRWP